MKHHIKCNLAGATPSLKTSWQIVTTIILITISQVNPQAINDTYCKQLESDQLVLRSYVKLVQNDNDILQNKNTQLQQQLQSKDLQFAIVLQTKDQQIAALKLNSTDKCLDPTLSANSTDKPGWKLTLVLFVNCYCIHVYDRAYTGIRCSRKCLTARK